jgi:hypothetical protein
MGKSRSNGSYMDSSVGNRSDCNTCGKSDSNLDNRSVDNLDNPLGISEVQWEDRYGGSNMVQYGRRVLH